jgi:hypothetical protein
MSGPGGLDGLAARIVAVHEMLSKANLAMIARDGQARLD